MLSRPFSTVLVQAAFPNCAVRNHFSIPNIALSLKYCPQ